MGMTYGLFTLATVATSGATISWMLEEAFLAHLTKGVGTIYLILRVTRLMKNTRSDISLELKQKSFKTMKQAATYISLVLLGAGVTLGGTYLVNQRDRASSSVSSVLAQTSPQQPSRSAAIPNNMNFIVEVAKQVSPMVVRIDAARTITGGGDSLRDFFGGQERRGSGSGFIFAADGKILTNAHVVDGANRVQVTLNDGRRLPGRVIGSDPVTDVAVVQVEAGNLPVVKLGDSEQIQAGEWVVAIGNPLGLNHTVTKGIISAIARPSSDIGETDKRVDFIQTDAAINPGNSGGPLLNANGEVIGINTAIIRGAQGIGFAVPVNTVKRVADQLMQQGRVDHAYIGVRMSEVTPELRQQLNSRPDAPFRLTVDQGVIIVEVVNGSPAQQAGLRSGDVILKIDNQPIRDGNAVRRAVEAKGINNTVNLEIRRGDQTLNIPVRIGTLPKSN